MILLLPVLDRSSAVPLYLQIQQHLLNQICSGAVKAKEPLPSEQQISAQLGVSRMTVRQALESLCNLSVSYTQRGKGTFVSGIKLVKNFRQVLSFTEEMEARGVGPLIRVASSLLMFQTLHIDSSVPPEEALIGVDGILETICCWFNCRWRFSCDGTRGRGRRAANEQQGPAVNFCITERWIGSGSQRTNIPDVHAGRFGSPGCCRCLTEPQNRSCFLSAPSGALRGNRRNALRGKRRHHAFQRRTC
jgi:DNA-binding transcriptional regulator YhcF (GntR family)